MTQQLRTLPTDSTMVAIVKTQRRSITLLATAYAQYTKDFNKANHFDIMAGYEYSHMKYWGDKWSRPLYPSTIRRKERQRRSSWQAQ